MLIIVTILVVLLCVAIAGLSALALQNRGLRRQIKDVLNRASKREKSAIAQSRVMHVAKISEQLAPLLPGFPDYNLKDVQWVGGTIDVIVWDGLEDDRDVSIVLLDIKTGNATASRRQRRIREAVDAGRVRFEVFKFRPEQADVPSDMLVIDEEVDVEWNTEDDAGWDSEENIGDDVVFADEPPDDWPATHRPGSK